MIREEDISDAAVKAATEALITQKQIARIWTTAAEIGMSRDAVYDLCWTMTKQTSLRMVSKKQAIKIIEELEVKAGRGKGSAQGQANVTPGRLSYKQLVLIQQLEAKLGWQGNPKRLAGYCKRITGSEHVEWINVKQASALITALKRLIADQAKRAQQQGGDPDGPAGMDHTHP